MSHPEIIAIARWEALHGDPAAAERGRWIVESPACGYLGLLEANQHDVDRAAELLRELLVGDGHEVELIGVSVGSAGVPFGRVVAAYGPKIITSGTVAPEDLQDAAGVDEIERQEHVDDLTALAAQRAERRSRPSAPPAAPWRAGPEAITSGTVTPEDLQDAAGVRAGQRPPAAGMPPVGGPAGAGGTDATRPHPAGGLLVTVGRLVHSGLPAPAIISQIKATTIPALLQMGSPDDVDDWAAHLRVAAADGPARHGSDDACWTSYQANAVLAGCQVRVWARRHVAPPTCGPVPPSVGGAWTMTPRRRGLLAAVAAGEIYAEAGQAWSSATGNKVSTRAVEALSAGWIEEGPKIRTGKRAYVLTGAGRDAARAYDRARGDAS